MLRPRLASARSLTPYSVVHRVGLRLHCAYRTNDPRTIPLRAAQPIPADNYDWSLRTPPTQSTPRALSSGRLAHFLSFLPFPLQPVFSHRCVFLHRRSFDLYILFFYLGFSSSTLLLDDSSPLFSRTLGRVISLVYHQTDIRRIAI